MIRLQAISFERKVYSDHIHPILPSKVGDSILWEEERRTIWLGFDEIKEPEERSRDIDPVSF